MVVPGDAPGKGGGALGGADCGCKQGCWEVELGQAEWGGGGGTSGRALTAAGLVASSHYGPKFLLLVHVYNACPSTLLVIKENGPRSRQITVKVCNPVLGPGVCQLRKRLV